MGICTTIGTQDPICGPDNIIPARNDCWVGMVDGDNLGQLNSVGCSVGCKVCFDQGGELYDNWRWFQLGDRWLLSAPTTPSRDAHGFITDLISREPKQIPWWGSTYILANCYDNFGVECHGTSLCDCFPGPSLFGDSCPPGTLPQGLFPTVYAYNFVKPTQDNIFCKNFREHTEMHVLSPSFRHSNRMRLSTFDFTPCTENPMVGCYGTVSGSDCLSSVSFNDPIPEFYNEGTSSGIFGFCNITTNAQIRIREKISDSLRSTIMIKNLVLDHIGNNSFPTTQGLSHNFDQLQAVSRDTVGDYSNSWNFFRDIPIDQLPVVRTINCRMQNSGCDVPIDIVITGVHYNMHLDLSRGDNDSSYEARADNNMKLRVFADVTIEAEIAFVPQSDISCPILLQDGTETTVEVLRQNPYDNHLPNVVFGSPIPFLDRLIYQLDENVFLPFRKVKWRGVLDWFGASPIPLLPSPVTGGNLDNSCCFLAAVLHEISVPGHASFTDSFPGDSGVYDGDVTFSFRNANFLSFCT